MRVRILGVLLFLVASTQSAYAGRIFGDIKLDGKPLPEGVLVTLQPLPKAEGKDAPPPAAIDSTATDKMGSYKFMVKNEGKCKLTVLFEKQSPSLEVFSYKEATRFDLILERKEGKLTLRRK